MRIKHGIRRGGEGGDRKKRIIYGVLFLKWFITSRYVETERQR